MALHDPCVGATDEWYTPPYVFDALGCEFDMDVASPGKHIVPWVPAPRHLVSHSLERNWTGFVWMNAPFGKRNGLTPWLSKFFRHGSGIALVPDRTSAPWWQEFVPRANAVLFVSKKIKFISADGNTGNSPSDGTCLLALGEKAIAALEQAAGHGLGSLMWPAAKEVA